ncbi:MAG: SMC-Scp complex subunit ScpB [Proteobacteria bacterium]|nr:SMC-Scp complex subunit ScpB [Pseudomonadota bacterium]
MENSFHIFQNNGTNEADQVSLSQIIEALLFSSRQSLTAQQIAKITGIKEVKKIRSLLEELNEFYQKHNRAFSIHKVAGGYQMRIDVRFRKWIKKGKITRPIQLSQAVMETLSIVAYQQPATRAEIEDIRTVDATYALRSLLDKKLIKINGRKNIAGRPLLYGTTKHFLEVFGFFSLDDLPRLEDFDVITDQENNTDVADTEN